MFRLQKKLSGNLAECGVPQECASQLNTNLGPTANPPTTRGHVPCKVYRGPMSVLMCVPFLFPMRLACASVYLRIGGVGRERFRPTCPAPTILALHPTCGRPRKVEIVGGGGALYLPLHG